MRAFSTGFPGRPASCLRAAALIATTSIVACNPSTANPLAGSGTGGGGTTDRTSTVSFYDLLMTGTTGSSPVSFKSNGTVKASLVTYLGSAPNTSVPWPSTSPLVSFEVTDGGTTRFLEQGRLLVNSAAHSAIVFGVQGSSDPNLQPNLVVAVRDTLTPTAGNAHVRWLHAWPGVGAVDIWSGIPGAEVRVVQNLAYGQISPYGDITAASALTSLHMVITPAGVARGVADHADISAVSQITSVGAYLVPLIYTVSNFSSPGSESIAIYQER